MRILLIAHNWNYLPLRPYNVGLHLNEKGYDVSLLIPAEKFTGLCKVKHVREGFRLYICSTILWGRLRKGADPLDLAIKTLLVRNLKYDLIFAFDPRPSVILPSVYGKLTKDVPLIIDWTDWLGRGGTAKERSGNLYNRIFGNIETFFEEYFRKYADRYTVICYPLKQRLRKLGYKRKVMYFPLGCHPVPEIYPDKTQIRARLKLPKKKKLIGQVGTLFRSDAELLFESLKLVREKMDVGLILIGTNNFEGSYEIPGDVLTTGKLSYDELLSYLSCCDIGAMPLKNNIANNGRWPSKLNDYLTAGVPIVATEISVVEELLKDCTFGETAKDNPIDFANKIVEMLSDRGKLRIYGENASKFAKNKLSWPKLIEELDMFLQETLEEHKAKLRLRL